MAAHREERGAWGLPPFLEEARAKGWPEPSIVGHRNIAARLDRYRRTAPWNGLIDARQFSIRASWPTEYDYPTVVYDTTHVLEAGDTRLELYHARGETDDHTWLWWPARRTLFSGYAARARASDALMTHGIFDSTARDSATKAARSPEHAPGPARGPGERQP